MSPDQNSILSGALYHAQSMVSSYIRKMYGLDPAAADYMARTYIERALADVLVMEAVGLYDNDHAKRTEDE